MKEPEKPMKVKGKDQIEYDADVAQRLQAELDEEARLEREIKEEANKAANIAEWDDVQAMMDADYELATKLQAEEKGEISIEESSKLFVELMNERKKHFNMAGYTLQQLRGYSFDEIKTLFETTMRKVNTFVPIESEVDRAVLELASGSLKRVAEEELDQESSKRQKTGESSELAEEPRDKEADELSQEELQQMMIVVPEQGMNVEALQTKYPIIDWEIYTEGTRKLKDQEDEVFGRIFSDSQGHNLRSRRVFEYILLMKIKLLIKKLEDSKVMIITAASYVSTTGEDC
ncbi:putative reverse transcriptase domain-containing protein [Tanacetum coccineum]